MDKKILIICEGVKKEPEIFEHVKHIGLLPQDVEIVSYKTNIYKLYQFLESESQGYPDGWDSLDLQLLLLEKAKTEKEKRILQAEYTDTLLIFDFDPQDPSFRNHPEKAYQQFMRLLAFFSESTDHGKLYLSYPMIEALQHISRLDLQANDSMSFMKLVFMPEELKKKAYKKRSENEGKESISTYDRSLLIRLILWHLKKAQIVVYGKDSTTDQLYLDNREASLLLQIEYDLYVKNHYGFVVSTSLFYIGEAYPQNLIRE